MTSIPSFAQSMNVYTVKNPQGGQSYTINYSITGAVINDIQVSTRETSLIILMNSTNDGNLVVDLPRNLIDAKQGTSDDQFIVLVDDTYASFHETKTDTDRTLSIAFAGGTERIEIIGTQVLPEFGPMPLAILALSVVSIIAISAKSRFRFNL
ncbi:MAG: PEFG-CTERM sorting domain-containing protein [Thaumarchaeota archaeon]|nr:PEFG-CTERM sorting domain-containing protein [Nitrososphaerota archaeon]